MSHLVSPLWWLVSQGFAVCHSSWGNFDCMITFHTVGTKLLMLLPLFFLVCEPTGWFVYFRVTQCKHENNGDLSHSPQCRIENEERGSQGQSKVGVRDEGRSSDRENMLPRHNVSR
jgi:hypothetical protein